jgi:Flp pilus assembly protein TadD
VTGTAVAATTPAPTADTLEAQGHSLMQAGSYGQAIPVLRRALAASPHGSLNYAYALYDLGRSLRLSGDPGDAARVLYRRLQIPNQTGTVRAELQAALLALGRRAQAGGGAAKQRPPAPGRGKATGNGHGKGNSPGKHKGATRTPPTHAGRTAPA